MLKNTNIKKIFTFVDEKIKLDIIKYNKNMQNIMNINLTNYQFYSKKYIILPSSSYPFPFHFFPNIYSPSYSNLPLIYSFPFHL